MELNKKLLLITIFCTVIFSCSSGNSNNSPDGSNNWDELTWDKDNWGS